MEEFAYKPDLTMKDKPHFHAAGTMVGLHIDICAMCSRDLRDPIHLRELPSREPEVKNG